APLHRMRRASAAKKTPEELVARGAAGGVLREISGDHSPRALHAAGVADLMVGDNDAAVRVLTEAAMRAPNDARIWSDLSAARYAAAEPDDRAAFELALDAAHRAIHV